MEPDSLVVSKIHLGLFCTAFTLLQFSFGISGVTMEAKGSMILFAPFRPYFLNWVLLMVAVFWANSARNSLGISRFLIAMLIHYGITIFYLVSEINAYHLSPSTDEGLGLVLMLYPETPVYGLLTYIVGNAILWILFFKSLRSQSAGRRRVV